MMDSLYIAWKYLAFYRWRTATLVAAITLIAVLPLTLEVLLNESERQHTEITPDNVDSCHVHGEPSGYPLTALLVLPQDTRAGTLLRGLYLESLRYQIVQPKTVVDGLLQNIFRFKQVLDGSYLS